MRHSAPRRARLDRRRARRTPSARHARSPATRCRSSSRARTSGRASRSRRARPRPSAPPTRRAAALPVVAHAAYLINLAARDPAILAQARAPASPTSSSAAQRSALAGARRPSGRASRRRRRGRGLAAIARVARRGPLQPPRHCDARSCSSSPRVRARVLGDTLEQLAEIRSRAACARADRLLPRHLPRLRRRLRDGHRGGRRASSSPRSSASWASSSSAACTSTTRWASAGSQQGPARQPRRGEDRARRLPAPARRAAPRAACR